MASVISERDITLADFLQVFQMGARSGVLNVLRDEYHGVLYLDDGQVVGATLSRGVERTVVASHGEAVIRMLGWPEASIRFAQNPSLFRKAPRASHAIDWLTYEEERRGGLDPIGLQDPITLATAIRFVPTVANMHTALQLGELHRRILGQIIDGQSLQAISDITLLPEQTILRVVNTLRDDGLVVLTGQPAAPLTEAQFTSIPMRVNLQNQGGTTAPDSSMPASQPRSLPAREDFSPGAESAGQTSAGYESAPARVGTASPVAPLREIPPMQGFERPTRLLASDVVAVDSLDPLDPAPGAKAASPGKSDAATASPVAGRGMLRAIMRKIRSL